MNIVIIEDEPAAVKRLNKLLLKIDPGANVLAVLESVQNSVLWFSNNPEPDLVFADIQLTDGVSFEIFEIIELNFPVVFVTAYDDYALQAFKVNSIDYLLKPVNEKDLKKSIQKYRKLSTKEPALSRTSLEAFLNNLNPARVDYKSRFLVKSGDISHIIPCSDVAYICIEDQLPRLVTTRGEKHTIEPTLDQLEKRLDPRDFYRINRQMIIHANAVKSVHKWFHSRLKLELMPPFEPLGLSSSAKDVIVSRDKVKDFRQWLDS